MLETKIFTENPFKALKRIGIIFGSPAILLSLACFLSEKPLSTYTTNLMLAASGIVISGSFILIAAVSCSFLSKTTLKCDFNGCQILTSNFWQSPRHIDEFKWSEVTDTKITESEVEGYDSDGIPETTTIRTFVVTTKDRTIDLMILKKIEKKNIEELINYVNKAVPQTKYIWVKDNEINNRLIIDSNYGYNKVARNH